MKIAVLTGGGHVSALNAGIEGITKEATGKSWEVLGATDGWEGVEKGNFLKLTEENTDSIQGYGGSILGSGRWRPNLESVVETVEDKDIDGIIALGGDDTLGVLNKLWEKHNIPAIGWPKTMDNDLGGTYFSLGYPTAIRNASETVLNSFDMAWTHGRVVMISVFGRTTDWVAAGAGAYGDADMIVPGEKETNLEKIYEKVKEVYFENEKKHGKPHAVMVIAEGATIDGIKSHVKTSEIHTDEFGHPKFEPNVLVSTLSDAIRSISNEELGETIKTAPMSLTYQLRNGKPLKIDKELGLRCGQKCVKLLANDDAGKMAAIERDGQRLNVGETDLSEGVEISRVSDTNYVNYDKLEVSESFFDYARPFFKERPSKEVRLLKRS